MGDTNMKEVYARFWADTWHPERFHPSTDRPWLVHLFRVDGTTHAVTSVRSTVHRDGTHRALCATVIGPDAQRPTPGQPIGCDVCLRGTTALGTLYD